MPNYIVRTGKINLETFASSASEAARIVANAEGCPESACVVIGENPWRVAEFRDGKFSGMLRPAMLQLADEATAETVAARWRGVYPGKDFRPVQCDAFGRLVP